MTDPAQTEMQCSAGSRQHQRFELGLQHCMHEKFPQPKLTRAGNDHTGQTRLVQAPPEAQLHLCNFNK